MPVKPRESGQRRVIHHLLAGDPDIGFTCGQHSNDLLRRSLVQFNADIGIERAEGFDYLRQRIACLSVGGGDGQHAAGFIGEHIGQAAHLARFIEDAFSNGQQGFTGLGHAEQALTTSDEQLHTQLIFQIPDMATDAGLRSE